MKVCRTAGPRLASGRVFLSMGLIIVAAVLVLVPGFSAPTPHSSALGPWLSAPGHENAGRMDAALSNSRPEAVPRSQKPRAESLSFEPNLGQTDSQVKFLARGGGYALFLTADQAVLKLQSRSTSTNPPTVEAVRMKLLGATTTATTQGVDELPAKSNYIIGNDPSRWHSNVPHFAKVRYHGVYPGVDLVYYGNQGQLEYDFNVSPGADPSAIQLSFSGERTLSLNRTGDLVVGTAGGDLRFQPPVAYQEVDGRKRPVESHFVLGASHRVGFTVGEYDRTRELVIDPSLTYSTYLGGTGNEACGLITGTITPGCPAIAVDPALNYYVAGSTTSATFPGVGGTVLQGSPAAGATANVFVSKFTFGNTLLSSTYLGGDGTDTTAGVAVDGTGNIYVAGTTTSTNFPTLNGFNDGPASGTHVFLSQLKTDLSGLLYSTYIAGSGSDIASGLAIDGKGNAFLSGITTSADLPTTPTALQTKPLSATDSQFFMGKVDTTKTGSSSMLYLTYFGGGDPASGAIVEGGGIAVDSSGNAYITGGTNFLHLGNTASDFPILNASQDCLDVPAVVPVPNPPLPCIPGATAPDAFVAKINPNAIGAASLLYSTYLGGTVADIGYAIAVDSGSNVYVTGSTTSGDFFKPTGITPFQGSPGGGTDAFLAKLNNPAANAAVTPVYFTYLGGGGTDVGAAVAVDTSGNARVTGWTSGGFPSNETTSFNPGPLGGGDAFIARINTAGVSTQPDTVDFASSFGGSGLDHGTSVALDPNFFTYVAGDTASGNFPTAGPPAQSGLLGSSDAFVSKLQPVSDISISKTTTSVTAAGGVGVGNPVTFTYTITNNGPDPTGGVTFTDNLPTSGANFGSITSSPGTCSSPTGSIVQCAVGTLVSGGTATVSVTITPTTATPAFQNSGSVSSSSTFSLDPNLGNNAASAGPVPVDDFNISVAPAALTVTAGQQPPATFQVTVTPLPKYPNTVSLSCSSGVPSSASCSFSTTSVTMSNTSPASSTLTISTQARPVTTTSLRHGSGLWYAVLLPVSGFTLLGVRVGSNSRRRKWLLGLCLVTLVGMVVFQSACGSSSSTPPTTGGTPAGTYTITITGTSGAVSRSQNIVLTVQ